MPDGIDRLDRIEQILYAVAQRQERFAEQAERDHEKLQATLRETAARQQYHDEAFERQDAEIKALRAAIEIDAENIRGLARIAEIHDRRLDDLEGGR